MLWLSLILALQLPQPVTPQERAQARLRELEQEAQKLAREESTVLNDLRRLSLDREIKAAELEARTAALDEATAAITALEREQASLTETIAKQRVIVRARAVELYKRGPASDLRRLVDAASAREAMRTWRQMSAASSRDAERFAEYRAAVAKLAAAHAMQAVRRREAERLRAETSAARVALDRSIRQLEQRIAAIGQERELNASLAAELRAAAAGLASTVDKLPGPGGTPGETTGVPGRVPISALRRALPWPAAGRVARQFRATEPGELPFNGIEIALDEAAPVSAVHDGEIAFSGPFLGYGHLIIVQHGTDSFTLYGHLS